MKDKLENFIRDNRKQFNEADVPVGIWEKIERQLDTQPNNMTVKAAKIYSLSIILKVAATITIVIASGLFYWQYQKHAVTDISRINPQLAKQQYQYASMIHEKREELKQLANEDPTLYREFSAELRAMDENYKKLKKDLYTSPNQEETVKAMIRNLEVQIGVLNQQLQIIDRVNHFKKKNENKSI